ncbi:MAG: hypothetical protein CMB80_10715 [Flammeovirgaceae bacterium]|nr:hypothetical protein [Flammeovirgaceae bacterium]|tara:strand:- start:404 stop:790 length:387 start_codon:yes stop_codon:yes gene_type:complete
MEQITEQQHNSLLARTLPSSLPDHIRTNIIRTRTVLLSTSSNGSEPICFVECIDLELCSTKEIIQCLQRGVLTHVKFGIPVLVGEVTEPVKNFEQLYALWDAQDIADADAAMAESGASTSFEEIKKGK